MNPQIAYLLNLSIQQIQSERLEDAERSLNQIIKLQPKNADALCFLSVIAAYRSKWEGALCLINQSIQISPNNTIAHSNKGNILKELGRLEDALKSYSKSIQLDPNHFEAHNNLGNLYLDLELDEQAIESYERAIALQPLYAEAYSNKGNALHKIGRYFDALSMYEKAISLRPNYADAWLNRGFTLSKLKRIEDALQSCNTAISINSSNSKALANKGTILSENSQYSDAIKFFERALILDKDYIEAYADLGCTLIELKRYDEALPLLQKAYEKKKYLNYLLGDIVYLKLQIGRWDSLDEDIQTIQSALSKKQKIIQPFKFLSVSNSSLEVLEAAKIWVADRFVSKTSLPKIELNPHKKIRVGYFSADYRNHPVSFLTAELFEIQDRERFEIFAFSLKSAEPGDKIRSRLSKAFDHFIDVESKPALEVAQLARKLQIDIAVDLGGHTQFAPTEIMSYRPAPIQVNFLGYPGTMGANYIDYIIADKILIPAESREFYSEKVVYLPDSYMVDDSLRLPSNRIFTRQECGLPEEGFIFCCFNNSYKFTKKILKSWANIMNATPNSVIWISENNESFRNNLIIEFTKLGIDCNRIIFAKRVDLMADHLARYSLADLFLDTNPYNAHTTAVDALKTGIPVLTFEGSTFAGRVAASLLSAIGLPELIVSSLEEYEALAIDLADNPQKIKYLKNKLLENKNKEPLFDTKRYVKNIEAAYIQMYRRYIEGAPLDHIFI
jgi:predicted O-linked N-acetylglucosamine transferase (SPINDLY family)